ncbi:hypothetical protein AWC38_SpisGene5070 [Stylophora pistillata]|uniref:G-protein coupled receptors family 1 profile domain-containing protein n=1 Tax=Stylophora pistillata TaxID=50429 RepID=A0A2B4SNR1_STYPI|nr:hypothetical protein AWC38_SpisGene5070 [Stylophora pistillata]
MTNITRGYTPTEPVPLFRQPQEASAVWAQLKALACISSLAFLINLVVIIVTSKRFKTAPFMLIQNFMVIDIVSSLVTAGPWAAGVWADSLGLGMISSVCRVQGFFHNTLATVFLATVALSSISRFLYVSSPSAYCMFFTNKPVVRLLMFTIWFGAGFLASPPLNPGTWGSYGKFEGTCWLSWEKGNLPSLSYSVFHTLITLGPTIVFTILAITVTILKKNSIHPAPTPSSMPVSNQPRLPPPTPTMIGSFRGGTNLLNMEVLYISCAQFLLYLTLWIGITVVESLLIVDWRNVDYRVVIIFTFLYQSRSLFHPFFYILLSAEIRNAFARCTTYNVVNT